ncbi:hypothetical protein PsorP6_007464 [Peronosclerospora sorghi]|uniref:Uncharacterized protein n=1 Tax=Peronosclerospora sorghi TaxID=230839 RepID=A0ACC0WC62_9STRA|nr:hypothetical protein PsorP6_007464 [Peronosclerospora sorghi]
MSDRESLPLGISGKTDDISAIARDACSSSPSLSSSLSTEEDLLAAELQLLSFVSESLRSSDEIPFISLFCGTLLPTVALEPLSRGTFDTTGQLSGQSRRLNALHEQFSKSPGVFSAYVHDSDEWIPDLIHNSQFDVR